MEIFASGIQCMATQNLEGDRSLMVKYSEAPTRSELFLVSHHMLKGAPVHWWAWVDEYQCSCKFISWCFGYTNLRVLTAVHPVPGDGHQSSSLTQSLAAAHSHQKRERERDCQHPFTRDFFFCSLKLVFNNKVLTESELILNHQKHVGKSLKSKKYDFFFISVLHSCLNLTLT